MFDKKLPVLHLILVLRIPKKKIIHLFKDFCSQRHCFLTERHHRHKILPSKHLIHQAPHQVQVLVVDLYEDAAAFGQQFARQQQAVAQVGQIRVDAQLPGVAVGFDLFRFVGEVFVLVLHVAAVEARLEVAGVPDAVGRVDVDHLHLAGHALLDQERVHHQQTIAQDQAVGPADFVLVELDLLVGRQRRFAEEVELEGLRSAHGIEDGARGDALVNVQRDHVHLEGGVFGLARPHELRVKVGVVGVGLRFALAHLIRGRDARRWVVPPPCIAVAEVFYRLFTVRFVFPGHVLP